MSDTKAAPKEPGSWAELVRGYRREKVKLQWKPEELPPKKYVTTFEKSREQRVFDPILQRFRNNKTETTRRDHERMYATSVLNKARDTQLATGQPYDILNHSMKRRQKPVVHAVRDEALEREMQLRRSNVDYNVISNKPLAEHHFAHPDKRPPSKPTESEKKFVKRKREYDILSGRYLNNHNLRKSKDVRASKNRAAKLFWQTHDFNPVNCTFYDREKEDAFVKVRQAFENTHGEVQNMKLPPRIRLAEGNLYNIMTMEVKNPEEMEHYEYHSNNRFNSTKDAMERDIRKRMEDKYDLCETRKLNKVAAKRFEEMTANGFDLVTGQSFYGKNSKPLYRPSYMQKPPRVWEKVDMTKFKDEKTLSGRAPFDKTGNSYTMSGTFGGNSTMENTASARERVANSPQARQREESGLVDRDPTPVPEQDVAFINVPSPREVKEAKASARSSARSWRNNGDINAKLYKEVSHGLVPKLTLSKSSSNLPDRKSAQGSKPATPGPPKTANSVRSNKSASGVRTGGF